ncbi:Kelch-like protein 5 [Hordeum vulgare]|nr:Kelch-like protein 5 [Hordeum vulgare]
MPGMPSMPEYPDTQESDTINTDAREKEGCEGGGHRIREIKTVDVHPELCNDMMDQIGFNPEAFMVALSHLLDNKS